ncbi:hypothetical protein [uncultured Tateyamaria sp.]|uniref:hypothetical protein n=1 Tax=uncultured Tateyamaria sp. TaxID=455651 RepID=UPI002610DFA9|nr:hypothetical protein [uncultured Tateyamaria sp.]
MTRRAQYAGLVAALLICAAPLVSAAIAGTVAHAYDCTLHEGFVTPCVIGGVDWGGTLYAMGVMGWLLLITVPAGAVILLALALCALRDLIAWRRG